MPSNAIEKTESGRKRHLTTLLILVFVFGCVAACVWWLSRGNADHASTPLVVSTKQTYHLEHVNSDAARAQGLSNRTTLAADSGMLFVFDSVGERCFWMKDMRFALDILWLDQQKRLTHIEHAIAPDTYPRAFCYEAQYVIELNAGEAASAGLGNGQQLNF